MEYIVRGVPNFEGKKSYAITQGAGMAVSKSDEAHEYASIQFLKWFTEKERNTLFSAGSSYLPVKKEANSFASWNTITEAERVTANYLETALNEKCAADARQIQQAVKNKDSREKAWKPYLSDENFNTWFEQITKDINEKMKDSDA